MHEGLIAHGCSCPGMVSVCRPLHVDSGFDIEHRIGGSLEYAESLVSKQSQTGDRKESVQQQPQVLPSPAGRALQVCHQCPRPSPHAGFLRPCLSHAQLDVRDPETALLIVRCVVLQESPDMARMAAFLTFGLLVLGASAQDVATQAAQQAGILVGDLLHKNLATPAPIPPVASPSPSPSPSPTVPPATTPYIPAPVIVTTPIPTSPPVPVR